MGVVAGLAVAVVRLPRVLEGISEGEIGGEEKYQSEMSDGRSGAGVEAAVAMAAKHAGNVVSFEDVGIYGFLLWDGRSGGILEGVFKMWRKGGARTVICEDVCFEEGDRVFEAGYFLQGVDSAGIAVLGCEQGRGHKGIGLTGRRGGGGRTRGLWHPGNKGQWYLDGGKEGKKTAREGKPLRTQLEQGRFLGVVRMERRGRGRMGRYLSHLSLLFLQGSQLMALRARFVGGRGSWSPGGGLVRERTVPATVGGRCCCCFERGTEEAEEEEGSLALVESSGMMNDGPSRIERRCRFYIFISNPNHTLT